MANPSFVSSTKLPMTQKPTMTSEGDARATYEDIFNLQNTIRILLRFLVEEAPTGGDGYIREDGSWVPIQEAQLKWGQLTGALADQADLQTALNLKIDDAPSDGKLYGRRNGAWEEIIP